MMQKNSGVLCEKNNKLTTKKRMIYFILQNKETNDIWTDAKDYNDMQSKYNHNGWTYMDITGINGRILLETISKSEFDSTLKMLKPTPLELKVEEPLKQLLEKIATTKKVGLIDVTTEAIKDYVNNNINLIKE